MVNFHAVVRRIAHECSMMK